MMMIIRTLCRLNKTKIFKMALLHLYVFVIIISIQGYMYNVMFIMFTSCHKTNFTILTWFYFSMVNENLLNNMHL